MLSFLLERLRLDGRVHFVERVHRVLDVGLVHLGEEALDALVVAVVVDHQEPDLAGRNKGRDVPLIKLVYRLQVHVVRLPLVLVH